MEKNAKRMGEDRILKLLVNFSIPAMVGMMVNSLYTLIDRIFVGQFVGREAFAGVGVTFAISMVIMSFGMLIGIGTSTRISISLGQQKKEAAEKILGNAFALLLTIAIVLTIIGLATLDPLLDLLGASPVTKPYAKQFISIILLGSVFQFIGFGLNGSISAQGNPRTSMLTMIINAAVNIILLILFIVVFKWGVMGSALATLIAQSVSATWVFVHLRSKNSMIKIHLRNMRLEKEIVAGIVSIGLAPFLMQLSGSLVMGILNKDLVHYGGDMAIGAMNAIFGLAIFLIMPLIGISQGAQPIIGYNYGAKLYKRVKKTLQAAIAGATIYTIVVFSLIQLFPSFFIKMFTQDHEIVQIGTSGIRLYLLMLPVIGFQIVSANFFLAIGKSGKSMLMNLLRQVIVLIPLLLILPRFLGLTGVWISIPLSDFTASLLTLIFLMGEIANLNKKQKNMEEIPVQSSQKGQECFPEAEGSEFVL